MRNAQAPRSRSNAASIPIGAVSLREQERTRLYQKVHKAAQGRTNHPHSNQLADPRLFPRVFDHVPRSPPLSCPNCQPTLSPSSYTPSLPPTQTALPTSLPNLLATPATLFACMCKFEPTYLTSYPHHLDHCPCPCPNSYHPPGIPSITSNQ